MVIALAGLFASSCSVLPSLDQATGGIPVSEIVLRLKCELSDAFTGDLDIDKARMSWVKNWTAQVDLTLEILDSATFAPGASYMQPLHNGYSTAAGPSSISTSGVPGTTLSAVAQSFAVSAGASLNGQASRTQTLGFAVSLAELKRWRMSADTEKVCAISDQMDLRGRLGLKEWIAQAFQPVFSDKLLFAGYHPKPGGAPGGSSPAGSKSPGAAPGAGQKEISFLQPKSSRSKECTSQDQATIQNDLDDLATAENTITKAGLFNFQADVDKQTSGQTTDLKSSNTDFRKEQDTLKKKISESRQYIPVLEPYVALRLDTLRQYGATAFKNQAALSTAADKATIDAKTNAQAAAEAGVSANSQISGARAALQTIKAAKDCSNLDQANSDVQTAKKTAGAAADFARDARNAVAAASKNIGEITTLTKALTDYTDTFQTIDPPISTIGQSIQFVLSYSGNVTPTWTFVTFKGPNSQLFSASGTRTHMLNITLGSPTGSAGTTNAALAQNQLYLLLNNRLPAVVQ
jgi:hypothetical protein